MPNPVLSVLQDVASRLIFKVRWVSASRAQTPPSLISTQPARCVWLHFRLRSSASAQSCPPFLLISPNAGSRCTHRGKRFPQPLFFFFFFNKIKNRERSTRSAAIQAPCCSFFLTGGQRNRPQEGRINLISSRVMWSRSEPKRYSAQINPLVVSPLPPPEPPPI